MWLTLGLSVGVLVVLVALIYGTFLISRRAEDDSEAMWLAMEKQHEKEANE